MNARWKEVRPAYYVRAWTPDLVEALDRSPVKWINEIMRKTRKVSLPTQEGHDG